MCRTCEEVNKIRTKIIKNIEIETKVTVKRIIEIEIKDKFRKEREGIS